MDCLGSGTLGDRKQVRAGEIGFGWPRRTARERLIGQAHVQRVAVCLRVDGHGRDAELATGANDPNRDLAAVRDQDLSKHPGFRASRQSFAISTAVRARRSS